jgi:uncharacterized protein (TIGR02265 family)
MYPVARVIELVTPHCDLGQRLEVVPPSAQIRGVWIQAVEKQVTLAGKLEEYRAYFANDHYSFMSFYPAQDFLTRLACGGAIVASPERVHEGMSQIMKGNANAFMENVLGRILLRVLSRDPVKLFEQGMAARRQTFSYGSWRLRRLGERSLEIVHEEEYCWIESAIAGSCKGTFEVCKIAGKVETRLSDRFNGSSLLTW